LKARAQSWPSKIRLANDAHFAANARLFDFTLAEADMAALDALDRTSGASIAREIRWWR